MKQGLLGDCWFLCACAALQKSRHLLEQVSGQRGFPPALTSLPAVYRKEVGRGGGQLNLLLHEALLWLRVWAAGHDSSAVRTQAPRHRRGVPLSCRDPTGCFLSCSAVS